MRILCPALVLLATFALTLSFVLPAENLLETAYDESESLPYELIPPLLGKVVQDTPNLQIMPIVKSDLFSTPKHASGPAGRRGLAAHHTFDSHIILYHTLRC
jgi:hypothetical protein